MIRRIAPTVVASLIALVLLVVPALAGSSFTSGAEAPADSDHGLTLTITEPESEEYGDTARVTVVAPPSFAVVSCEQELTWDCTADAENGRVTFDRTALGTLGDDTLQFTVHTPQTNGTYRFSVVQADGAEEPNTVNSAPAVTVVGGNDPEPEQDDSGGDDSTDDGGSTGGDTSGDTDSTDSDSTTEDTTADDESSTDDGGTSTDDTSSSTTSDSDDDSTSGSGGAAPPRRTEGRSNGTSLEITPGESTTDDDPSISAPDVADDPAIAPPSDDEEDDADTGTATMTAIEGQADDERDDSGGLPWQQLLGGALLVAGGAALAVRRWDVLERVRGWDPLERIRRWRS